MTQMLAPLPPETLERLRQISTPTLSTQLLKLGFRSRFLHGLPPTSPEARMAGEAVTVRFVPAREDLATLEALGDPAYPQRRAIEHIRPGQVLVLDCRRVADAAAAGDILVARLQARGAAGLVADGGIRDFPPISSAISPWIRTCPSAAPRCWCCRATSWWATARA